MVFTHAFVGAISTKVYLDKIKNNTLPNEILYFLGILGSVLPDFDITVLFFFPNLMHRYFVTHSLVLYTTILLVTLLIAKGINNNKLKTGASMLFLGILSHLLLDVITGGSALLAPFYPHLLGFSIKLPTYTPTNIKGWFLNYFTSIYMIAEITLVLVYFYVLRKEKDKVARIFPWVLLFTAISATALLIQISL